MSGINQSNTVITSIPIATNNTKKQPLQTENKNGIFKRILVRLLKQNNRSLATVFGVISGLILGIILVCNEFEYFPLVGKGLPIRYRIIGIFLSAGTGGNLSSYIGGCIDIISGDKTIIDLYHIIYKYLKKLKDKNHRSNINNNSISNNEVENDITIPI